MSCVVSEFDLKDESFKVYKKFKYIKEKADVIIDFSKPSRIDEILDYAINNEVPIVIGTTGYTEEQNKKF
ncbi:dihydrodipicolinate reductase, family protein [[Clostridium] sordellii ATCC 9714]|nr:dihydrodipicolinate reductase, family protein [[Clostridium] sordellii ATCC 9714] [Paeniclostridium sordellii ATCC 9714]